MKKKNVFHKVYVIALMAFFTSIGLTIVIKPQADYSRNENRYLEKLPALTWDTYKTGEFGEHFDKAVTDQFPFRDFFTGMSTNYRKLMGFHDVGDVYLGKDHYYFDKKLEKDMSFPGYQTNLAAVRKFADTFRSTYDNLKVMLIPSPASVLHDDLPNLAQIYDDTRYFDAANTLFGDDFIDTRDVLKAAAGSESEGSDATDSDSYLYFRTDHHWTDRGAYEAYRVYEESMGRTPKTREEFGYTKVSDEFYGTMFSRALDTGAVPDTIELPTIPDNLIVKAGEKEIPFYDRSKLDEKDHYAVYFGGNYPAVTITNPNVIEEKKLLVFKDSFANSFIPLIVNDYSEITLIDPRYETRPMAAVMTQYAPDDVLILFEMSNFALTKEIARLSM